MSTELAFVLAIALVVAAMVVAVEIGRHRRWLKRVLYDRVRDRVTDRLDTWLRRRDDTEGAVIEEEPGSLSEEERSEAELERLHSVIEDRKQVARDSDISYHLWGLYNSAFRQRNSPKTLDPSIQDGLWQDMTVRRASTENGLNRFEFDLKGARYVLIDDEERQGWADNIKRFSLFLHDESGRCLIEVPIKLRVDKSGRNYTISSGGPKAFLPGEWISDFIAVKLKNQRVRNQEIRAQKHQERLDEIEELKARFGIGD